MKKGLLFVGVLLVAVFLITGTVLVVNAQTPTPETPENEDFVSPELDDEELEGVFGGMMGLGRGMMGRLAFGQKGVVREYVINALSEATGLSVEEINERLTNNETLLQIAKDAGLSDEEIKTLLTDAHKAAWEAAGVDTTGTFYQNMVERMKKMLANRENFQGRRCPDGLSDRTGRWINPES